MTRTPSQAEIKRAKARRALVNATNGMLLCARGLGVPDSALKHILMEMRADRVFILTDEEAQYLIDKFELREA